MLATLTRWLALPLDVLANTPLRGHHRLTLDPNQTLELRFGHRDDLISRPNQEVSVRMEIGRLQAEYSFVTDQSCLRQFVDGLAACMAARAGLLGVATDRATPDC